MYSSSLVRRVVNVVRQPAGARLRWATRLLNIQGIESILNWRRISLAVAVVWISGC
eukprot:GDKH01001225.1.p1 GENE.GDKH01001225.1~~GDKH01001225.1.p1  ORF type:complete len:56 (-),score=1.16 GDKH01001225.1:73-240(-)